MGRVKSRKPEDKREIHLNFRARRAAGVEARVYSFEAGLRFLTVRLPGKATFVVPWFEDNPEPKAFIFGPSVGAEDGVRRIVGSVLEKAVKRAVARAGRKA